MFKRITALVLCLCMLLSLFVGGVYANDTADHGANVGKYAQLNPYYAGGDLPVHDGSRDFAMTEAMYFGYDEFEEGLIFRITDWYLDSVNAALWYQVEAYQGQLPADMPAGSWILQNYTDEEYADEDTLLFVEVEPEEGQTDVTLNGEPVSAVAMPKYDKPVLSATTNQSGDVSYRWQILAEADLWVDIYGQTAQNLTLSYGLVKSLLVDDQAWVRCVTTADGAETVSEAVCVTVEAPVEEAAAAAEEPEILLIPSDDAVVTQNVLSNAIRTRSGAATMSVATEGETADSGIMLLADEPEANAELEKVNLIVEYQFGDGSIAANPWTAELSVGKEIGEKIKLPLVLGYQPTFTTTANASIVEEEDIFYLQLDYPDGITENTTLTVTYQPTSVKVTVLHYWQNEEDDHYTLYETKYLSLLTGSTVGNVDIDYPGVYNLLYEKPVVAADGSTVVEVYYDRYYYLMKFDLSGGYGVDPIYARYGQTIEIGTPTRPGYTFQGWTLDGTTATIPTTMPEENRIYKAEWEAETTTYDVVFWYENANDNDYAQAGVLRNKSTTSGTIVNGSSYKDTNFDGRDSTHFTYSHADENVEVKGDGSTVVNVYFSRNVYDLTFVMGDMAGDCDVEIHASHTDYTGDCYTLACDKAHVHDDKCNRTLSCGMTAHTHTDACLACGDVEHTHSLNECYQLECNKTSHNHAAEGCTLSCKHTAHTLDCYSFEEGNYFTYYLGETTKPTQTLTDRGNGIFSYTTTGWNGGTYYYLQLGEKWYCVGYDNWQGDFRTAATNEITFDCSHSHEDTCYTCGEQNGTHTHSVGAGCYHLTCGMEEHTHSDGCYDHEEHAHNEDCYTYQCGAIEHTHTEACYELTCDHLHYHSGNTCYLVVTRKYDADISGVWREEPISSLLDEGYVFQSNKTDAYYSFLEKMPGYSDLTLTSTQWSGYYHQWFYYLEIFPGMDTTGLTTKTDDGITYYLYDDTIIYGSSSLRLTYDEDYFPITGFDQRDDSVPSFSSEGSGNNRKYYAYLYYTRNSYALTFSNNGETVSGKGGNIYYQADISGQYFVPDYPSSLEPGVYEFEGWYTSSFFGNTKFEFTTTNEDGTVQNTTMPAEDITLYAKWVPVTRTVQFFLDRDDYEANITIPERLPKDPYTTEFATKTLSHGEYLTGVDVPEVAEGDEGIHPYSQYDFNGWYYIEDGEEKRFEPGADGIPVTQDLKLYAKWSSNVLKAYTVYFALDTYGDGTADVDENGNIIYVADPITGSTLAGNSKTFDAKGGTMLYTAYQTGYYPNVVSHTITLNINHNDHEGDNTFTFLYTPNDPVPYTVRYRIKGTDTQVPGTTDKTVNDNTYAVVTENFVAVPGYMPDAYQKTLVVTPNGNNVITFWYTEDTVHALYQVNHYIQNLDGTTWSLYDDETVTGNIGTVYSAEPVTINGFSFDAGITDGYNVTQGINSYTGEKLPGDVSAYADGKVSGTLTENGMQLNLYYVRNMYPYQIYFLEYGSNRELKETIEGNDVFGKLISHQADAVITETDAGIEFELYDTEPETKEMTLKVDEVKDGTVTYNKLVFYYTRCTQNLTVTKTVTGDGADLGKSFNFTVTIDPKYSFHQDSYAYGDGKYLAPVDGVLSFSLKHGESITLQDLPTAEYTVTEVNLPLGYYADFDTATAGDQSSANIVLDKDTTATVNCINSYEPANLTVTKTVDVVEDNNTPEVEEFEFTITVPTGMTGSYDYTVGSDTRTATVADGKMTLTLEKGQTATFLNLPVGTYAVDETDYTALGYKSRFVVNGVAPLAERNGVDVQLVRGETQAVECINTFPVGDLVIQKTVAKEFYGENWTGDTFTFMVERTSKDLIVGNTYNLELDGNAAGTATVLDNHTVQVTIIFTEAEAATLDAAGESLTHTLVIKNLPTGTYTVTETMDEFTKARYTTTANGVEGYSANITLPTDNPLDKVSFVNTLIRTKGDLFVSKEIQIVEGSGKDIDKTAEFTFTVVMPTDADFNGQTYTGTKQIGDETETHTFTVEEGKFTFSLKHGENMTLHELPVGSYVVKEDPSEGYESSFPIPNPDGSVQIAVEVETGKTTTLACINKYPVHVGTLTITKTGAEAGQVFVYEVKNNETNETMTVTVTGNSSVTIHDVPVGEYTVTQINGWSWRYSDGAQTVTIAAGDKDQTVTFNGGVTNHSWLDGNSDLVVNSPVEVKKKKEGD